MAMELNLVGGGEEAEKLVFCPKPERPASKSRSLYPLGCKHSSSHASHQESRGVLDMAPPKSNQEDVSFFHGSPPARVFHGSPPARASNPIVHDPQFHQLELFSPVQWN